MNSAIVTGASGFIGSWLVRGLLNRGIRVLALGRKPLVAVDPRRAKLLEGADYLALDMKEIGAIGDGRLRNLGNWDVIYNLAWGGSRGLSDQDVSAQLENVAWCLDAFALSSRLGIRKFVHVGTMEEAFADRYLAMDFRAGNFFNRHCYYALAKRISKTALRAIAARHPNTELMFATNSHVMGPFDDKDSFLQVTLQRIIEGSKLEFSAGTQFFDVISIHDLVDAYLAVGAKGRPGSDYWIGSGTPRRLKEYVEEMIRLYPTSQKPCFGALAYNDISLYPEDFDISLLVSHTAFRPQRSYAEAVQELHRALYS